MKSKKMIDDQEILLQGIEALNQSLGVAGALRFLSILQKNSTDYVDISEKLYQDQTIDDIFERANQNWLD
ncbi:hypothetical protein WH8501_07000 [Crocosphaera watsonii WH 8501]|uniref:Uncharacterized protein n=4 Tax=Crocosphaera watsonii TaxID=263511 RepID=T2JZX9_CROWT|nr:MULTISPECIES: hypothetical protein [Crocosphaera]EHJ11055.1 hypothetical protein CWATWH0003_4197 [Crocosphaera watsonii WH 0003]MCH2245932.1 hypothetical protein [Crocosphaera sp.]MDJ0582428.1 hypothetical protein [Crocosphaera sp.]NQZ62732.1 hypothetical protein [Crocosphaera sp.]CCQ55847.1 hypothetical protein CWATWH0005_2154 [Crocosphaera watsonii WH 0005]